VTTNELKDCRGKTGRKRCAEVTFHRADGRQPHELTVFVVLEGEDANDGDFARQGEAILRSRKGHLFEVEGWTLDEVLEWSPETGTAQTVPPVPLKVGYHQTLSEVLVALGWRHERPDPERHARLPGHRAIFEPDGTAIGLLDVCECWALLRRRGLIAPAKDDTP
jgi:hypothetical protein